MVISRSSIPQQISKPGVKKKKKGKSVFKKPSKLLGKKLEKSSARKVLSKGLRQAIGMKNPIKTLLALNPVGRAIHMLRPTQVGSSELFSDEELKEMKRKEKENEKSIKKYMGGSLNKGGI